MSAKTAKPSHPQEELSMSVKTDKSLQSQDEFAVLDGITKRTDFISVRNFILIQDCPGQRNTEDHARKAIREHLKFPSIVQMNASIAELSDGTQYKLDGHTRALLWKDGRLKPHAKNIDIIIYEVENLEQVNCLYKHFDAASSAKNAKDQLSGIMNEHDWYPKSKFFREGAYSLSMEYAHILVMNRGKLPSTHATMRERNAVRHEMFLLFKEDLFAIDDLNVSYAGSGKTSRVNAMVVGSMIATYRAVKNGRVGTMEKFNSFWSAYLTDAGDKDGNVRDPVQALTEMMMVSIQGSKNLASMERCNKIISAFDGYCKGKKFIRIPISTCNLEPYQEDQDS